jgi:hypothetical protein
LIEQFIVAIWCGASRFAHAEAVRFDRPLMRLFKWDRVAGHKAIVRLFERFDMLTNERVQAAAYGWIFDRIETLKRLTLDMDSTVLTRYGEQAGANCGYNPSKPGRASHHPLLAFVSEERLVANFWLRPGNAHSANNVLQFLESTLHRCRHSMVRRRVLCSIWSDVRNDHLVPGHDTAGLAAHLGLIHAGIGQLD